MTQQRNGDRKLHATTGDLSCVHTAPVESQRYGSAPLLGSAKPRLTSFGDGPISDWHRTLGANMPAVNLDFLLVEYDRGRPCAVIEYKHQNARPTEDYSHPSYQALRELCGNRLYELPLFLTHYHDDCSQFRVRPLNITAAVAVNGNTNLRLSELEYARFLERLRTYRQEMEK